MKYKNGVYIEARVMRGGSQKRLRFSREIETAMEAADALSKAIAKKEIVITSILDGKHSTNSLHYTGNAFDMRKWIYTEKELKTLVRNLAQNLGENYDVVLEKTHIHVEYDPKPGGVDSDPLIKEEIGESEFAGPTKKN